MEDNPFSGIKTYDSYRHILELFLFATVVCVALSVGALVLFNKVLKLGVADISVWPFIQGVVYTVICLQVLKDRGVDFKAAWQDWDAKAGSDALNALKYFVGYLLIIGAMLGLVMLAIRVSGLTEAVLVRRIGGGSQPAAAIQAVMVASRLEFALQLFSMCILAPIGEELFFRRIIYTTLRKKMSFLRALFAASVLFAVAHGAASLLVFPVSLLLCYVYEKERRLPVNIMLHGLINLLVAFVKVT
ncbi:MAG: CPBP family intramembrane metalloprotease [Elusimicrobiota bacterium]|nr:CPBP family intramembrane metalloprotease [Elusimicrobiota bacterium]